MLHIPFSPPVNILKMLTLTIQNTKIGIAKMAELLKIDCNFLNAKKHRKASAILKWLGHGQGIF